MRKRYFSLAVILIVLLIGPVRAYMSSGDFTSTIIGATNTEAILTYTAPFLGACSVQVSPSSSYSPLINDVNTVLFSGSDQDSRNTSTNNGVSRVFVIGKRTADIALDGNRYSRALQAYTTYYYKVICGTSISTGQFSTTTLPSGSTYSDVIPGDSSGNAAWPTIGTDRTQKIIDPQTGVLISRLSLLTDSGDSQNPTNLSLGTFGGPDICNPALVADNTSAMGYHCMISGNLYWINPSTGDAKPVGIPYTNYDGNVNFGSSGSCGEMDTGNPNRFYCVTNDARGKAVLVRVDYTGQNTFNTSPWPICTGSNAPCGTQTILTPSTSNKELMQLMHNFDSTYPYSSVTNFNVNGHTPIIRSIQNGKIIMDQVRNFQDSYAWIAVFDPGNGLPVGQVGSTAGIIAEMSTNQNYPVRWCSDHALVPIGNQDWMYFASNNLRPSTFDGFGTFATTLASGNLSSTTTSCPANSFGASVCSNIVVAGEPCNINQTDNVVTNPSCGIPGASYLQDAKVGDVFGIQPSNSPGFDYTEYVQLITKSGNNWTIARGQNQSTIASHPTGQFDAVCSAHDTTTAMPLNGWFWDYINDPHGVGTPTGTPGTTIVFDKTVSGTHSAYRSGKFIDETYTNPFDIFHSSVYKLRTGGPIAVANDSGIYLDDLEPEFSGQQGIAYGNTVDSHVAPFVNNQTFVDARPMLSGLPYSAGTYLGSGVYKYAAGAISLNRKILATFAYSNDHILKDISGPGSNITTASNYSYCYVENAGECRSGSLPTEVYAKSTTATESDCPFPGVGNDGWNLQSICIGDNGTYTQALSQVGSTPDAHGKNSRMITHALTTYNREDVFWNTRTLPDLSNILFTLPQDSVYGNGSGQLFMGKLPPFSTDSVLRDDFIDVPVTIPAPTDITAVSAVVSFGYAENGLATDLYCTSRKEACVKGGQSGHTYDFAGDNPSGVACLLGCTISVPLIPARVAYLKVSYKNLLGTVVQTLGLQSVAVESPYQVSSTSATITPPPVGGGGDDGGTLPLPIPTPIIPPVTVPVPSPIPTPVIPISTDTFFSLSAITSTPITKSTTKISWTTNKPSDTQVEYGLTTNYGQVSSIDATPTSSHLVTLTGLILDAKYHYRIKSRDSDGHLFTSSDQTFISSATSPQTNTQTNLGVTILTSTLSRGMKSAQVLSLQRFLVGQGFLVAKNADGSFGPITEKAVQAFQKKYGIVSKGTPATTGYGNVGPKTRAFINSLIAKGQ